MEKSPPIHQPRTIWDLTNNSLLGGGVSTGSRIFLWNPGRVKQVAAAFGRECGEGMCPTKQSLPGGLGTQRALAGKEDTPLINVGSSDCTAF